MACMDLSNVSKFSDLYEVGVGSRYATTVLLTQSGLVYNHISKSTRFSMKCFLADSAVILSLEMLSPIPSNSAFVIPGGMIPISLNMVALLSMLSSSSSSPPPACSLTENALMSLRMSEPVFM
uniref:ORF88 n=1 Tax=Malaco herpesvirus 1 TaxID=3031797 RepID=A0AA48P7T7_9VIRU|nr:TPA_asm: ORF88 [Malaco herpesvirus 1]